MSVAGSDATTVDTFTASLPTTVSSSALPHSRITVLIELSSDSSTVKGRPLRVLCVGLQREPVEFTQRGPIECVEIRLRPSDALRLGLDVGELCGDLAPVDRLFGQRSESLTDQLAHTPTRDRPKLIRSTLRAHTELTSPSPAIEMVRILERADASQTVDDLVGRIGTSRSTIWRNVTAALGMSPKQYLMLRRFESGVDSLRAGDPIARAAIDAGYADQAHFHRDVKRFARQPPTHLRQRTDATFIQDGDSSTHR